MVCATAFRYEVSSNDFTLDLEKFRRFDGLCFGLMLIFLPPETELPRVKLRAFVRNLSGLELSLLALAALPVLRRLLPSVAYESNRGVFALLWRLFDAPVAKPSLPDLIISEIPSIGLFEDEGGFL
jgi:hypothetical protein